MKSKLNIITLATLCFGLAFFLSCSDLPDPDDKDGATSSSSGKGTSNPSSAGGSGTKSSNSGSGTSSAGTKSSGSTTSDPGCGNANYNPDTKFCFDNVIYDKCGGQEYDPAVRGCQGSGQSAELNASPKPRCGTGTTFTVYAPATQFCSNGTIYSKCDGRAYDPVEQYCKAGGVYEYVSCANYDYDPKTELCDTRGGTIYKHVKIGTQIWMAKNLNYDSENSFCPGDKPENCNIYGRVYNYMMAKTICPQGWHLPSREEWGVLMQFVNPNCPSTGTCPGAGKKLKSTEGWENYNHWEDGKNNVLSGNGTDEFGFTALPAGQRKPGGGATSVGEGATYWQDGGSTNYQYRRMAHNNDEVTSGGWSDNGAQSSVRCIKN